ncbi:4Fe-4S binding protein [Clostridium sediminicola]|uniref:4Fe-4S binding protein n=1 Tax=Clostridium sediminicola TaxID=3114879 RepID=UPI0031F24733
MVKYSRKIVQLIFAILTNSNLKGFIEGKIFRGNSKSLCVPGLNCYSCPGALGSCPIGSLQAVFNSMKFNISFYVSGMILLFATILGRFTCGWLCPFGLFQELIYKIPSPKKIINKHFKYIKYGVLLIFVIILPIFLHNSVGIGNPTFCKYICPAGTLEGGIPLLILNKALRSSIGILFFSKFTILMIVIILSIIYHRFFCKVLCPLGAIYSLFNKYSFYQLTIDENKCIHCNKCINICKMEVNIVQNPCDKECIRCGDCITICPTNAIGSGFKFYK